MCKQTITKYSCMRQFFNWIPKRSTKLITSRKIRSSICWNVSIYERCKSEGAWVGQNMENCAWRWRHSISKPTKITESDERYRENANQEEFYKRIETAENQYWDGGLFRRWQRTLLSKWLWQQWQYVCWRHPRGALCTLSRECFCSGSSCTSSLSNASDFLHSW